MADVESKARKQAEKHFREFMDDCNWPEMLEKYAELSNRYEKSRVELLNKDERGGRVEEEDFADVWYYGRYRDLLAFAIADNNLVSYGYEEDKNGFWILKNQPPEPPSKKKFGFWG